MAKSRNVSGINPTYILSAVVTFVGIAILFWAYAILANAPQHLFLITTSATGTTSANPSEASTYFYLNATGSSSASAVSNLSIIANNLNSTLMPFLNNNSSLIQTLSYSVFSPGLCYNVTPPIYNYPYTPAYCRQPNSPKFYVASEYVLVTVPNVSDINQVLISISKITGLSIGSVSSKLSSEQLASMNQEALSLALTNATSQARALVGNNTGLEIRNITIENGYLYYPTAGVLSKASASGNQTFFPGSAAVTKSILVIFKVRQ